ncbi:MAG: hypothetical protein NT080_07190 [Spirochaetes bacterium]|nr:hypothetical protein [Spirochaetota bacterium]
MADGRLARLALAVSLSAAFHTFPLAAQDLTPVISPPRPAAGNSVDIDLRYAGLLASSAVLESFDLPPGLRLVGTKIVPERKYDASGALMEILRLTVRLVADEPGSYLLGPWIVESAGKSGSAGPVHLEVAGVETMRRARASWGAPGSIWARQAFAFSVRGVPDDAAVRMPTVPGLVIERRGPASFVASSVTDPSAPGGTVVLPASVARAGDRSFAIGEASIPLLPWKARGSDLPAVGRFAVTAAAGRDPSFAFRVTVSGAGNLPSLGPPGFMVVGPDGARLPGGAIVTARRDRFSASDSGYSGAVDFIAGIAPEAAAAGEWSVVFEPFAALDPATGSIRLAGIPRLSFMLSGHPPSSNPAGSAFTELAAAFPDGPADSAAGIAARGVREGAKGDLPGSARDLYLAERMGLSGSRFREALAISARLSGEARRPRDLLPPPAAFWWLSAVSAAAAAAALSAAGIAALAAGGRRPTIPVPPALRRRVRIAVRALALSATLAAAAMVSTGERNRVFVVSEGGPVRTVPSASSSVAFELAPGVAGVALMSSNGWTLARFPDGRRGWLPGNDGLEY